MICNSFYKDPLTGMANFFGLLECDIENSCGDKGAIVVIDIVKLSIVNRDYGKEVGDIYIKKLAEIISYTLVKHNCSTDKVKGYRYGGDEFLLVFPGEVDLNINDIVKEVDDSLRKEMIQYGIPYGGIRSAVWFYDEKIPSVIEILKQSSLVMAKVRTDKEIISELPEWADNLIEKMMFKVSDTLSLLREVNTLAMNDEISGLPNHRAASLHLNEVIEEYNLMKKPFSLLFIDGDNLKRYNDRGYEYGNKMIRELGVLITDALRRDDKVFRWLSGDEFMIVLRDTIREGAFKIGERIREQVENKTNHWEYPVTVSIGVASCPEDGIKLAEIIAEAEGANALAKRSGKNCVL